MKCLIAGSNIKTFAKVIHSFCRIGEDVYFEASSDGMQIKTINSSRSSYFSVMFKIPFFQQFALSPSCANKSQPNPCKLSLRSIILIFKSLANLEKTQAEYLKISLKENLNKAIFKLYCKCDIVKTYNICFIECENLNAYIPEDIDTDDELTQTDKNDSQLPLLYAKFKCAPKIFSEVANHFANAVEEITFCITKKFLLIKNYSQEDETSSPDHQAIHISNNSFSCNTQSSLPKDSSNSKRLLDTTIKLFPSEFSKYKIYDSSTVFDHNQNLKNMNFTFCVKEFKAALAFFEYMENDISIRVECPGKPLLIKSQMENYFVADFITSTLSELVVEEEDLAGKGNLSSPVLSRLQKKPKNAKKIKINRDILKNEVENDLILSQAFDESFEDMPAAENFANENFDRVNSSNLNSNDNNSNFLNQNIFNQANALIKSPKFFPNKNKPSKFPCKATVTNIIPPSQISNKSTEPAFYKSLNKSPSPIQMVPIGLNPKAVLLSDLEKIKVNKLVDDREIDPLTILAFDSGDEDMN